MAKLRRLSGSEVIRILEELGYEVTRVKGSHYRLRLETEDGTSYTTVPVHGKAPLPIGTLKAILRQVQEVLPEEEVNPHFYADYEAE